MSEQQSETSSDCIISPLPQLEPEDDEYTDMAQKEEMNQSESSSRIESELQSGDVAETRVPREVLKRKGFSNFSIDFLLSKSPTPKVPKILIADNVVGHTDAKIAPFVCERCSRQTAASSSTRTRSTWSRSPNCGSPAPAVLCFFLQRNRFGSTAAGLWPVLHLRLLWICRRYQLYLIGHSDRAFGHLATVLERSTW